MRWIVSSKAMQGTAASASWMGHFETEWLANDENVTTLADLNSIGSTAALDLRQEL